MKVRYKKKVTELRFRCRDFSRLMFFFPINLTMMGETSCDDEDWPFVDEGRRHAVDGRGGAVGDGAKFCTRESAKIEVGVLFSLESRYFRRKIFPRSKA